ncbi:hypothetical protein AcW1_002319 [Taiwanofungus camphoratus]|nr:hypothetical protein AcV5_010319 [Antrodia cinnamomea]KAI0944657.1 hypothetical protein AcW1_002319 [Antrodia cinnamomea]KAI0946307.1 hypothetical protein AcV7_010319 [Antrodia cinnamomea]
MMKTAAVISLLASVALAQSSSSLIPAGISSNCSSFLTSFNQDSSLSSCTAPLINATSQFGPGANTSTTPTSSTVESALDALCSNTTSCSSTIIRSKLANFYSACNDELTSASNQDVLTLYDVLYSIIPLQEAMCTKDDDGKYCVMDIASSSNSSTASASGVNNAAASSSGSSSSWASITKYLWNNASSTTVSRRDDTQTPIAILPNATTFSDNNILFLFLSPSLSSNQLCTSCARNILTSYISFESNIAYGPGLSASPLMKGQSALYSAVQSTCGASFLNGAVQAAGSLSHGLIGGAAPRAVSSNTGMLSALMGGLVLVVASVF